MLTLILQTSNNSIKPKTQVFKKGFTFLEILIVLTLIILIIGSVTPNFFIFFSKPYESEFKHLNSVIKILRNDAIIKNSSFCLIFDLKKQQMIPTKKNLEGDCSGDFLKKTKILKPHVFDEELILQEARTVENNFSPYNTKEILKIYINSSGFVTPFFLKFSSRDFSKSWIIKSVGIMGKLDLKKQ